MLKHPRVVGFGEIGLVHSVHHTYWSNQMSLLSKWMPNGTCRQSTYSSLPWYPWGQWYGSPSVAFPPSRTEDFPGAENPSALFLWQPDGSRLVDTILSKMSLKFSFNRSVSKFHEGQTAALRQIEEARLLLETNAPYFHRRGHAYSAPAELYDAAEIVVRHRNVSTERILSLTKDNVVRLYGGRR